MKPLAIDLYCGLGGWAEGFLAEGYEVIGFDIERRPYPGQLVLQDVLTLHGSQFRNADCIVASPPCQAYSYMAMPWNRSKRLAAWYRGEWTTRISHNLIDEAQPVKDRREREEFRVERVATLNALFNACFRIQREACEAAGHHIPLIVENVKGAQPWVGRAKAHFGSFYLWGDIESVGGAIVCGGVRFGNTLRAVRSVKGKGGDWFGVEGEAGHPYNKGRVPDGLKLPGNNTPRMWSDREVQRLCDAPIKNDGCSWFNIAHNTESGVGRNPDGRKGYEGGLGRGHGRDPASNHNSKSSARKVASAQIAKIPSELARHIARAYKPTGLSSESAVEECEAKRL